MSSTADTSKLSLKTAWAQYPDAQSPAAACLADKVISESSRLWAENTASLNINSTSKANMQKLDAARFATADTTWAALHYEEQRLLPNSARALLASQIPYTAQGFNLHANILGGDQFVTSGFEAWERKRSISMLRTMGEDPIIKDGKERWDKLSISEKLTLAQRISDIQSEAYGSFPINIKGVRIPEQTLPDGNKFFINGQRVGSFIDGNATIRLNINKGAPIHSSFQELAYMVGHETAHDIQD